MESKPKMIEIDGNTYECNVESSQIPTIERILRGTTDTDLTIQSLPLPERPAWLRTTVKMLRWYRRRISPRLGNRCVFEPSCSHYSELAFREKGLLKGFWLTARRLHRCRPGAGGMDMP
ncbi:MAG: membrane protein insertion efficiency factor YidD [Candidatus Thiodiazotropha sp.]